MDRIDIAKKFADVVVKRFGEHIQKIILFGSVAERKDNEDSDIDLIILTDNKKVDREIDKIVADFVLEYRELLAPIVYLKKEFERKKDYSFQKSILKNGVLLYGR